MNKGLKTKLLWLSVIGSSLFVLLSLLALIFEIYAYYSENWFVFWHGNSEGIKIVEIVAAIAVWLVFPTIYLWLLRYRSEIHRRKLYFYGAISNSAFIVLPLINMYLLFSLEK